MRISVITDLTTISANMNIDVLINIGGAVLFLEDTAVN